MNTFKKLLILTLLTSINILTLQGQNKYTFNADSCLSLINKYLKTNKSKAIKYTDCGIEKAKQKNDKAETALFLYKKAKILDLLCKYDSAVIYYKEAEPLFELTKNPVNASKCCINIGVTEYYYGNFKNALKAYKKADSLLKETEENKLKAKVANNIALIYKAGGQYDTAITMFYKNIDLYEKTNDKQGIANSYENIGIILWEQKNFEQALKNYFKSAEILKNLKKYDDLAGTYNNIGLIYGNIGDTAKAIQHFNKSSELYEITKNKQGLATVNLNKAGLLEEAGILNEAEILTKQALDIFNNLGYSAGIFTCKLNLCKIYSMQKKYKKAVKTASDAIKNKNQSLKYLADLYIILADNYYALNKYKNAYSYLKKYSEIKDSVFNLEKNKQINELITKYETEKKERENIILKQESAIKSLEIEKKDKKLKNIYIILFIIIIFSVISITLYIQKRNSYITLVRKNVELAEIPVSEKIIRKNIENEKYQNTKIKNEEKEIIIKKLIKLLEEEKIFTNEKLTINDLAKKINTNRNYLSQIINDFFNTNFNNFINEYRVKEAGKKLSDKKFSNYTIEAIGNMVGFHSKASFNSAFKKFTGVTPSFFKKNANTPD